MINQSAYESGLFCTIQIYIYDMVDVILSDRNFK